MSFIPGPATGIQRSAIAVQRPALIRRTPTLIPVAPVPVVPVVPRRRSINPLIPLCCLALILSLIAATIVLSLIPVYLQRRNLQRPNPQSAQFTLFLVLRNGSLPVGPLSAQNCLLIQNELRRRALSVNNLRTNVPTVISCTVVGNSTAVTGTGVVVTGTGPVPPGVNGTTVGRKKRQLRAVGNLISILVILSPGVCPNNQCVLTRARLFINFLIGLGDFFLTLILPNGSPFRFLVAFIGSSEITLVPTPGIPVTNGPGVPVTNVPGVPVTNVPGVSTNPTTITNQNVLFYAVTNTNLLLLINAQNPGIVIQNVTITGVNTGDFVTNIDFRPATGQLYGTSNSRLYVIDEDTGVARVVGGFLASGINGSINSMEFNPVTDMLRITTDGGDSLQVNPENGEIVVRSTTAITGGGTTVAYSNNLAGATTTTLFIIDAQSDSLLRQNPPDNFTVMQVGSGFGVNITIGIGFDIDSNGLALAADKMGDTIMLYVVDVNSGTFSQTLGVVSQNIFGLAIPTALTAYVIQTNSSNFLIANLITSTPNPVFASKTITGLQAGELLLGLDFRPLNGQLFGLGSTSRLYTINLGTGAATAVGSGPFNPPLDGTTFGFDFNPTVDRIRVVSNLGQNLRLNPDTGVVAGQDIPINPNSPNVTAVAYTNNVANAMTTVLYDIDSVTDRLSVQTPANNGTLTDVGPLGIDVDDNNGFDIGGKTGIALALLTVNGITSVHQINLTTGAATMVPNTAIATGGSGFTVSLNV